MQWLTFHQNVCTYPYYRNIKVKQNTLSYCNVTFYTFFELPTKNRIFLWCGVTSVMPGSLYGGARSVPDVSLMLFASYVFDLRYPAILFFCRPLKPCTRRSILFRGVATTRLCIKSLVLRFCLRGWVRVIRIRTLLSSVHGLTFVETLEARR